MRRRLQLTIAAMGILLTVVLLLSSPFGAESYAVPTSVSVFPIAGTKYAEPGTQIAFRGVSASGIGPVQVIGSKTGVHSGHVAADSDGNGGSFLPDKPFAPGETVKVVTKLNVVGGSSGTFSFTTATPDGTIEPLNVAHVPAGRNGVQHFHSRGDLQPPALTVLKRGGLRQGDIFVAPQYGPAQDGPLILDPSGNVVWFKPVPNGQLATDFRVQQWNNKPVLTWWQGYMNHGSGRGTDIIYDQNYKQIATVNAANGLQGADLHEFLLTNQGNAYIIVENPIRYPGIRKPLMDSVVQEIDVKTGLVLFEWDALDHVPLSESFFRPTSPGHVFDPYHLNSVSLDHDGSLIISMRNTWGVYKVDHSTGNVIWTVGTSRSSFKMGRGTQMAFQHNAIIEHDGSLTVFDDGAGPPRKHSQSRGLRLSLNTRKHTASLVKEYDHSPPLVANYEGGLQQLGGGEVFVGWGQQPYFTEFNSRGRIDFDARFNSGTDSYRAYRFQWHAQPPTLPALAVSSSKGSVTAYASWNGANDVSSWRLLAGSSSSSLSPLATATKHGFETAIRAKSTAAYFQVQALGSRGQVLASSSVVR